MRMVRGVNTVTPILAQVVPVTVRELKGCRPPVGVVVELMMRKRELIFLTPVGSVDNT